MSKGKSDTILCVLMICIAVVTILMIPYSKRVRITSMLANCNAKITYNSINGIDSKSALSNKDKIIIVNNLNSSTPSVELHPFILGKRYTLVKYIQEYKRVY